jgi:ADP-ribose pyrophosphatase YjhB (NUDIX family)
MPSQSGFLKRSVAVIVRGEGDRILAIRRPDDEAELPGIWGLPAGSYRGNESLPDLIHRIGAAKLGVRLHPVRLLASGRQQRPKYRLEMELWEASMEGVPSHPQWQWAEPRILEDGKRQGSLCCALALG